MSDKIGRCLTTLRDDMGDILFKQGHTYVLRDDHFGGYESLGDDGCNWAIYEDSYGGRLHAFELSDPPPARPTDEEIIGALVNAQSIAIDLIETGDRVCTARAGNINQVLKALRGW